MSLSSPFISLLLMRCFHGQLVNWSTGHRWGNFKAALIAPLTPQALSWSNHKQVLLSGIFIASFAILCLVKRQKIKHRELLCWNWSELIWGKSSTRNRGAGKYFLSGRSVCHSGPEMLPFVKGRVRRDIIFFRSQECEAMTNKSHLMQCKDKKKTVSQVISSKEPGSRIHASPRAWLAGSEQPHRL